MTQCKDIEPLFASYVDADITPAERDTVDRHRRVCAACDESLQREHVAREAMRHHVAALTSERAPGLLVTRLSALSARPPATPLLQRTALRAAAAALALVTLGAWWLGLATRASTVVLAAQLTADHEKCFLMANDAPIVAARAASYLEGRYGFALKVPDSSDAIGLKLVGARRCLSGEGTNAHLLYTWHGESVSLYMLPSDRRPLASVKLLGHNAQVWAGHNGSYVLVTRGSGRDLSDLVNYMRHATQ
jgi:anti-sigma factor RsiW